MATKISTKTSGVGGLEVTGDASGVLELASNNGTTAVTVDASQNVGIGTSSPATKLHCSASGVFDLRIQNTAQTNQYMDVGTQTSLNAHYLYGYGSYPMLFATNATERMRIDAFGNVCIGTNTAGAQQLTISASSAETGIVLDNTSSTGRRYEIITGGSGGAFGGGSFGIWDRTAGEGRMLISSTGVVNFYGGSGGQQVVLRNGGDLALYAANNSTVGTIWVDSPQAGMGNYEYVWMHALNLYAQKTGYDRQWDNYPSISVRNDTTAGPQGEYRIHGIGGISGGDFSVYLRVDGGGNASDGRRKTDIVNIENAIETVEKLRPVTYVAISSDLEPQTHMSMADGKRLGFIAQDLIPILPEVVKDSGVENVKENGWADQYSVDYASMVSLLTAAIQEQQVIINDLKSRIETLEGASV